MAMRRIHCVWIVVIEPRIRLYSRTRSSSSAAVVLLPRRISIIVNVAIRPGPDAISIVSSAVDRRTLLEAWTYKCAYRSVRRFSNKVCPHSTNAARMDR